MGIMAEEQIYLGIDIGGSGIKGAPVDISTGSLVADRIRITTPKKSTPQACADVVNKIFTHFKSEVSSDQIGVTIPAPSRHGVVPTMYNLHKSWIGVNADELFTERLGHPTVVMNDADAAGYAEAIFGAAKDIDGVVIVTTLGTGIGTAIIHDGQLLPNTELGHIEMNGRDAEKQASSAVKTRKKWSYKKWATKLTQYYQRMEALFWPDLFVVGGGVSKDHEQFLPLIDIRTPIVPAALKNEAGIIGAALIAANHMRSGA